MPRHKNIVNDKDRKTCCAMTENSIVYKVPMGDEATKIGHFVEAVVEEGYIILRYATKKEENPGFKIEKGNFSLEFK